MWLLRGKPHFKEITGMHPYYHCQSDPYLIPLFFLMLKLMLLFLGGGCEVTLHTATAAAAACERKKTGV